MQGVCRKVQPVGREWERPDQLALVGLGDGADGERPQSPEGSDRRECAGAREHWPNGPASSYIIDPERQATE